MKLGSIALAAPMPHGSPCVGVRVQEPVAPDGPLGRLPGDVPSTQLGEFGLAEGHTGGTDRGVAVATRRVRWIKVGYDTHFSLIKIINHPLLPVVRSNRRIL